MSIDWYFNEIKKRYGNIKRTRGPYLYTEKGVRLVDMYLDGARSIMGRGNGSGKSMLMLKNAMAKGLTSNFESGRRHRAEKAILKTLVGFQSVRFFSSKESCAYAICKVLNIDFSFDDIHTNSMDSWLYKNGIPLWKPLSNDDLTDKTLCYVVPPFLLSQNVHIVATKGSLEQYCHSEPEQHGHSEPVEESYRSKSSHIRNYDSTQGDTDLHITEFENTIAQCTFEGLARSFYDYEKEKVTVSENDFCIFDDVFNTYFERKSCYLFPSISEKQYKNFVIHCMDKGLLISPYYNVPSIVPFSIHAGDIKKLTQSPFIAEK